MKKLVLLLSLISFVFAIHAQSRSAVYFAMGYKVNGDVTTWATTQTTAPALNQFVTLLGSSKVLGFVAGDTIGQSTKHNGYNIYIWPNQDKLYDYYFALDLKLDSGSAGSQKLDSVVLQGKMYDAEAWTTIGTVKTWYGHPTTGSAKDTLMYFGSTTPAALTSMLMWRQLRFRIHANTVKFRTKVANIDLKFATQ